MLTPLFLRPTHQMSARRESAEIEQTMADMMYLLANDRLIEHLMKECNNQAIVK